MVKVVISVVLEGQGLTENAGPENAGPQKQDRKMEDKLPKAIT